MEKGGDLNIQDIWKHMLELLNDRVGKATYQTAVEAVVPERLDAGVFVFSVNSEFLKNRMDADLLPVMDQLVLEDKWFKDKAVVKTLIEVSLDQKKEDKSKKSDNKENSLYSMRPAGHSSANLNPKYTFDTFVVSSSNEFAYAACTAVANNPGTQYNPLFIYGGVGLGKTHLMQAIGHFIKQKKSNSNIRYVTSEQFTNDLINSIGEGKMREFRKKYRTIDALLVDDIEFLAGKDRTQEEFFHTFNDLFQYNSQIVLCSDRPPSKIQNLEDRLVNRFEKGLVADIQMPDFELRMAILQRMAEGTGLVMGKDVLRFMAENITNNIRMLEGAFIKVMSLHSLLGRPIDVPMVEQALKDIIRPGVKKVTIAHIQKEVCRHFKITVDEIRSKKREQRIALPRQVAMYLARELTELSLALIGNSFGGKDHTTVMHSCAKIMELMEKDERFRAEIEEFIGKFREE